LKQTLNDKLYGQHLFADVIVNQLKGHITNQPQSALVFSFHGSAGTGKTYSTKLLAENMYKKGMQSKYVHLISATKDYNHDSNIEYYKVLV
jgi:ATP-dependent Clp protease ATP-binding subunit ClpA